MPDHGLVDAGTGANLGTVCLPFVLMVGDRITHLERAYVVLERRVDISPHWKPELMVMLRDEGPAGSILRPIPDET